MPFKLVSVTDKRTWSQQHPILKLDRPLTEAYAIHKLHPENTWWKEKMHAPPTFMGFPDVIRFPLLGGSLYVEQMDSLTLTMTLYRCLSYQINDFAVWGRLAARTKAIHATLQEPCLPQILQAFSQFRFPDPQLINTLFAQIQKRLPAFQLVDCAWVLHATRSPNYHHPSVTKKVIQHIEQILIHRPNQKIKDLLAVAQAFKTLSIPLPSQLFDCVYEQLARMNEGQPFDTPTLFQLVDLVASLPYSQVKTWVLNQLTPQQLQSANPAELLALTTSLSLIKPFPSRIYQAVLSRFTQIAYRMEIAEVTACIWLLSNLKLHAGQLYNHLRIGIENGLEHMNDDQIWLATLGFLKAHSQLDLVKLKLLPRLETLFSKSSNDRLLHLLRVLIDTEQDTIVERSLPTLFFCIQSQLTSLSKSDIIQLASCCSVLTPQSQDFFHTFVKVASSYIDNFNQKQLLILLQCFIQQHNILADSSIHSIHMLITKFLQKSLSWSKLDLKSLLILYKFTAFETNNKFDLLKIALRNKCTKLYKERYRQQSNLSTFKINWKIKYLLRLRLLNIYTSQFLHNSGHIKT